MRVAGKIFEAFGIAAVMIGLIQGIYGDMWGELYLFLGGIAVFLIGRRIERRTNIQTNVKNELHHS